MKRYAFKLLVFLLPGAILNVAVAWGCALLVEVGSEPQRYRGDGVEGSSHPRGPRRSELWIVQRNESFGVSRFASDYLVEPDGSFILSEIPSESLVPPWAGNQITLGSDDEKILLYATGWPLRALDARFEFENRSMNQPVLHYGIRLSHRPLHSPRFTNASRAPAIPLRPIWPGFAINTIFYAAILWLLFMLPGVPFALRRRRRINRGLCPKCAYDLRGGNHAACPECGKAVNQQ